LLRAQSQVPPANVQIKGQASKQFWALKTIRPDVLIDVHRKSGVESLILDTKWKIPGGDQPSDEDLKQMFAYNVHFGARRSLLVYPRADNAQVESQSPYAPSASLSSDHHHACGTHFIDLFDVHKKLRTDIGVRLLNRILSDSEQSSLLHA
jgi:5-methylcytosine-specific restriction enzyme subunit McrC